MCRGRAVHAADRHHGHVLAVRHGGYPPVVAGHALDHHLCAVGQPDAPLAAVPAVVGEVYPIHHVIFVAEDVLVAQAAGVVHLRHGGFAVVVLALVPGVLVDKVVYHRVRHVRVYLRRFFVADGVRHAVPGRAARHAAVRVLARAALLLAVPATVLGVEQVGDAEVHQRVDLLHAALLAVIVEVRPGQARGRTAAGDAGAQLRAHDAAAHHRTQVLVVGHPVGFHVLYLVAVAQNNLVKLGRVQD